jgi:sortase A
VLSVIGEILVTLGVVALLYVSWQLWIGDFIIGSEAKSVAQARSEQWAQEAPPTAAPTTTPTAQPSPVAEPPALPQPGDGEVFGVIWVPRFGPDFAFTLAGGVSRERTLDTPAIGHYPDTAMPGQVGNFAVAGHRGGQGGAFIDLPTLHIGDAVVIETPEGWYTYRFRNLEYVKPSQVEVLLPLPQVQNVVATGKYITMTTCSPLHNNVERAIAYGVFESFTPRADGAPASLTGGLTS